MDFETLLLNENLKEDSQNIKIQNANLIIVKTKLKNHSWKVLVKVTIQIFSSLIQILLYRLYLSFFISVVSV